MSEENESSGSSLKKTLLGTLATIITAGGAWLGSTLFGGGSEDKAPVQAAPVINITNSNQQTQQASGSTKTIIIKEKEAKEKPAPKKKDFTEEEPKW